MDAATEFINYILETHVMFSQLSDQDKQFLLPLFETRVHQPGETIASQGKPMEGMFYLHTGMVRLKETSGGKVRSLGTLSRDASIGEAGLLGKEKWPFDVLVEESTTLFCLPAETIHQNLKSNTEMKGLFEREVGNIAMSRRLRGLLGDATYKTGDFLEILHNLGVKHIPAGKKVFFQGKEDSRLYLIEDGEVELRRAPVGGGQELSLDRLGRDVLIGETGAIAAVDEKPGAQQTVSAVALVDVSVVVIPLPQVKKIFEISPDLREKLRLRVRDLENRERDEMDVRRRGEGLDQRIKLAQGVTEEEYLQLEKSGKVTNKFRLARQRDESDCAAACLTMITRAYDKDFTLGQVVELTNLNRPEATPNDIISGAEKLEINASGYAIDFEELQRVKLPGIVGWQGFHYAVLHKITPKHVHLADSAKGFVKLSREEFEKGWTEAQVAGVENLESGKGVFIGLAPTLKFTRAEKPKRPIYHFISYLLPYKKYFGDALLGALILNFLGLASPLFVQTIVDTVVVHKDISLLNMMLGGMVLVAIFRTITTVAQSLILSHTTARIDMRMMSEFYRHILSLPMSFFLTRNKGEILTRFGENAKIRAIIAGSTITLLLSTLMIFIYLLMMFGYSSQLTIVAMIFIPMYIGITLYFTPRIKALAQKIFLTNSQSQSYLIESLNGIETLKATANEYMARSRWENAVVGNINMGFQMQKLNLISNSLNQLVQLGSTVAILWVGANLVIDGEMTIGGLMGFQMLLGMVMGPIMQMVQLWNSSQEVRIAIDRVSDVLNVKPEREPVTSADKIPATLSGSVRGKIQFDKVNFSYMTGDKENQVMRDFTLTIQPGERVAFVGSAGCGKSTIAKMVLGFNMPTENGGSCFIDGKDVRDLDLADLRRNIGVVLQDGFLFGATVAENIALGDPEPNMKAVWEAARRAGADEFIINLAMGYQTRIGEKGVGLSGGQRQRICIARALYRRPKIMIFDEATSALDNKTEALVQKNIREISAGRTTITIAHRLSTIIDSDYICFIQDGKVAEKGSHEQLTDPEYLRENGYGGLYYGLAKNQFNLPELTL
ncbi:MAG: ATP-binding cassette domain-containing protein [Magnetococcales bacterium]|nr:ATP-binding cassette domain-containing protein [Magnetococcales bacterium]